MEMHSLDISKAINHFFDGLFFGFSIVMILAIIGYVFFRNKSIYAFIHRSIRVVRVLAIIYFVIYLITFIGYYKSPEFELSSKRANGTYKWAYWFMVLRPVIFCALLLLFWLKFWVSRLRYVSILVIITSIVLLPSPIFFEKIVILLASYSRDYYQSDTYTLPVLITIAWFIIEKAILFSAIVFASKFISKTTLET